MYIVFCISNNKMNSLVVVNNCIVLLHICILVSLTTASEIGISSCRYLGEFEEDGEKCRKDVVKLERLPVQCSSFVFNGVICQHNYDIVPKDPAFGLERIRSLVEFENRAHRVFIHYTHGSIKNWFNVLYKGDLSTLAESVQKFVSDCPVAGLILHGIEPPRPIEKLDTFYKSFVAYVKAIKDINPVLEIGLYLSARSLIESANGVVSAPHFDFPKINDIMDFYIIELASFNDCSNDLLHGGITPIDSPNPNVMTLNKLAATLDNSTIAKDKLYFEFLISPEPKPEERQHFKACEISYNEYCENDDDKVNKWCADSPEILYSKGEFASHHGNGFIGRYIDLVDRDNKCDCGKYVTFDIMVQGFNIDKNLIRCDKLN